jgi:oligopeptide/dipeptide ABC transporter ATP-binding protein
LGRLKVQMGLAVLLITHNLGIVAQTSDRVAVMYAGLIMEEAPTAGLFQEPSHPYTQGLLQSMPHLDFRRAPGADLATIPGQVPDLSHSPPGCLFQERCRQSLAQCSAPPPWVDIGPGHKVRCWLPGC